MRSSTGLALIVAGAVLMVMGVLVWSGLLSWFGRLPGDFRIERPNVRVYVPLTSMLVSSLAVWLVLALVRRLR
jgi:hypothetical protein